MLDEHHDIARGGDGGDDRQDHRDPQGHVDTVNNVDMRDYIKYPNSKVIADPTVTVQDDQEARRSTSFSLLNQTETQLGEQARGRDRAHLSRSCRMRQRRQLDHPDL